MPPTPEDASEAAAAVFEGRVVKIESAGKVEFGPRPRQVHVQVVRTFKGGDRERLTLTTAGDSALCGYPFRTGETYLIYADGGGEALRVSLCSRTRPIDEATEDLAALGIGHVPVDPSKPDAPGELTYPADADEADADEANADTANADTANADAPKAKPGGGCASCSVGLPPSSQQVWGWSIVALAAAVLRLSRRKLRSPS